jgi:hypothetical protein
MSLTFSIWAPVTSVLNLDTPWPEMVERYEHSWKRNGLRHGTGTGTVLFCVRFLTVSCPAFRNFGTVRHGMVKALDTTQNDTGTRHGTERGARHESGHSSNDTGGTDDTGKHG